MKLIPIFQNYIQTKTETNFNTKISQIQRPFIQVVQFTSLCGTVDMF